MKNHARGHLHGHHVGMGSGRKAEATAWDRHRGADACGGAAADGAVDGGDVVGDELQLREDPRVDGRHVGAPPGRRDRHRA